jgi:hypothetical protein
VGSFELLNRSAYRKEKSQEKEVVVLAGSPSHIPLAGDFIPPAIAIVLTTQ